MPARNILQQQISTEIHANLFFCYRVKELPNNNAKNEPRVIFIVDFPDSILIICL